MCVHVVIVVCVVVIVKCMGATICRISNAYMMLHPFVSINNSNEYSRAALWLAGDAD